VSTMIWDELIRAGLITKAHVAAWVESERHRAWASPAGLRDRALRVGAVDRDMLIRLFEPPRLLNPYGPAWIETVDRLAAAGSSDRRDGPQQFDWMLGLCVWPLVEEGR
jgi:hypothetical protein